MKERASSAGSRQLSPHAAAAYIRLPAGRTQATPSGGISCKNAFIAPVLIGLPTRRTSSRIRYPAMQNMTIR